MRDLLQNVNGIFFDITYDLEIPTVFGICFGEADYGSFVAVGSSTRATIGEALKKSNIRNRTNSTIFQICFR